MFCSSFKFIVAHFLRLENLSHRNQSKTFINNLRIIFIPVICSWNLRNLLKFFNIFAKPKWEANIFIPRRPLPLLHWTSVAQPKIAMAKNREASREEERSSFILGSSSPSSSFPSPVNSQSYLDQLSPISLSFSSRLLLLIKPCPAFFFLPLLSLPFSQICQ